MSGLKQQQLPFILLTISIAFYVLGIIFPIMATKSNVLGLVLNYTEVKLFDSIQLFWQENDYLLAIIILVFTFVFPILKYLTLCLELLKPNLMSAKTTQLLHKLDKWSMIDVFLVALLLLNFKLNSSFIIMDIKIGTHFIALSVIFRMLTVHFIKSK